MFKFEFKDHFMDIFGSFRSHISWIRDGDIHGISWNHGHLPDPCLKLEKELLKLFIGILGHSIDLSQDMAGELGPISFFEASESLGSWPPCANML